jgi:hypothetical protein
VGLDADYRHIQRAGYGGTAATAIRRASPIASATASSTRSYAASRTAPTASARTWATALNRSTYNGTRAEDNINQFVRDFETATDQLRSRFSARSSATADVENVLRQATYIDDFMTRNSLSMRAENDWTTLKGDLNQLASAYSVAWNWDVNSFPGYGDTTARRLRQ